MAHIQGLPSQLIQKEPAYLLYSINCEYSCTFMTPITGHFVYRNRLCFNEYLLEVTAYFQQYVAPEVEHLENLKKYMSLLYNILKNS